MKTQEEGKDSQSVLWQLACTQLNWHKDFLELLVRTKLAEVYPWLLPTHLVVVLTMSLSSYPCYMTLLVVQGGRACQIIRKNLLRKEETYSKKL